MTPSDKPIFNIVVALPRDVRDVLQRELDRRRIVHHSRHLTPRELKLYYALIEDTPNRLRYGQSSGLVQREIAALPTAMEVVKRVRDVTENSRSLGVGLTLSDLIVEILGGWALGDEQREKENHDERGRTISDPGPTEIWARLQRGEEP